MNVEIINPEVLINLYRNHGQFARECYATPEKYEVGVGKKCEESGHMSGSRCEYIKFRISGVDRGTAEQCLRHEIGTFVPFEEMDNYTFSDYSELVKDVSPDQIVKNMASFRYIDKGGFEYDTPDTILACDEAKEIYDSLMADINAKREAIKDALIRNDVDEHTAVQDANFVLPRATTTSFVIGFTPEALIHFCHKRLCSRAQGFIRSLAMKMKSEVKKYNENFAKELVPHCVHLMWCPEGDHSCHTFPTKAELKAILGAVKKNSESPE